MYRRVYMEECVETLFSGTLGVPTHPYVWIGGPISLCLRVEGTETATETMRAWCCCCSRLYQFGEDSYGGGSGAGEREDGRQFAMLCLLCYISRHTQPLHPPSRPTSTYGPTYGP